MSPQQLRIWQVMCRHGEGAFRTRARWRVPGAEVGRVDEALRLLFARHAVLRLRLRPRPDRGPPLAALASVEEALRDGVAVAGDGSGCIVTLDLPAYGADEASIVLLARQLEELLAHLAQAGETAADFELVAEWERDIADSEEAAMTRGIWQERIAELRAALEGWHDAPADTGAFEPRQLQRVLSSASVHMLSAIDRTGSQAEAGAALLAAWNAVARKRLGVELPVGVRLDGRSEPELAGVVGPMSRVAPVPLAFRAGRTLEAHARAVRPALFEANARQDSFAWPADEAAAPWLGFARRAARAPAGSAGGVTIESVNCVEDAFFLRLVDEGDAVTLAYDASRLDEADACLVLDGLCAFLDAAAATPQTPVERLPVQGRAERALLLRSAAAEHAAPAPELIDTIRQHVRHAPDRIAVDDNRGGVLSYAGLARRASLLAHHLRLAGAGAERLVALCLPPSPELAMAIVAVMEAGAAFVPLDPDQPTQRLVQLLDRLGASALVAHGDIAGALAPTCVARGTAIVDPGRLGATHPPDMPPAAGAPAALAYAIFTSGSTGEPRCVGVPRAALARQIDWFADRFAIDATTRLLARTSPAFDAAVWEWLVPLAAGATIVCGPDAGLRVPLGPAMRAGAATHVQLVPNLLERILADEPDAFDSARHVFLGGEVLSATAMATLRARGLEATNLYGPTECCVQVAAWSGPVRAARRCAPVGTPVTGALLTVIDDAADLAPVGAVGMLVAGGECLARGYLDDAAGTAAAFVPDPGSGLPGARLFLTGDVAARDVAGVFRVFGRRDDQVKIRGARVELAEVGGAVRTMAGVVDCAVVAEPAPVGGLCLVAIVVAEPGASSELETRLAREAARLLPGYMVPARFVVAPALPRLASGKLDRGGLARLAGRRTYEAPVTATERAIAQAWSEVLGVARVGRHDGFFEIGGHSILMLRVIARLRATLGQEVPLRLVYESRDVAELAQRMDVDTAAPQEDR